jgi:hypothetical protein
LDALPKLGDIASPELEEAVIQLVASKHRCDAMVRQGDRLASLAGYGLELWTNDAPDGFAFWRSTFPFVHDGIPGKSIAALVPARRTIGDAHRRYPEAMPMEEQEEKLAFLQLTDRTVWGNQECATYTWIRPLGLFLAGEGKNRVSLFQRLGIEWIPACVSAEDYPSPDRIVLYMIKGVCSPQCWAVLDGRWAEQLANPAWALPVLRAYGVEVEQRWPTELPPLTEVMRAQEEIAKDHRLKRPQVDLDVVRAREAWENEHVRVSPLSRLSLTSSWKFVAAWLTTVLISTSLLMVLPENWTTVRLIAAGLLGGALGVCAIVQTKFIPMRRRDIQPPLGYRAWSKRLLQHWGAGDHLAAFLEQRG